MARVSGDTTSFDFKKTPFYAIVNLTTKVDGVEIVPSKDWINVLNFGE